MILMDTKRIIRSNRTVLSIDLKPVISMNVGTDYLNHLWNIGIFGSVTTLWSGC
ncbi:hypothetical protein [Candidatus Hodgkinia cicadicola]|uniref:hypothetical protein n=1 Tax=Candidatus Hodgkinia cicadicola TaxID=573658 RepID=UPI00241578FC